MFTMLLWAVFSVSAFNSNTDSVISWAHVTSSSVSEASEMKVINYSNGCYITQGAKEIRWAPAQERPGAFVPPVVVVAKKDVVEKSGKKG